MLILRIKQAEQALADGRLEQAFELTDDADLRAHRQGQRLLTRLLAALVERGRGHLEANRFADALADAERAAAIDRHHPQLADLRASLADAMAARQRSAQQEQEAVAAARQCVQQGWLSGGAAALEAIYDDCVERVAVERAMAMERAKLDSTLRRVEAAIAAEDLHRSAELLASIGKLRLADPRLMQLAAKVTKDGLSRVRQHLETGSLRTARTMLDSLTPIAEHRPDARELRAILDDLAAAWRDLEANAPGRAARTLRRLHAHLPEAAWLRQASDAADQAARACDAIAAGPLGEFSGDMIEPAAAPPPAAKAAPASRRLPDPPIAGHDALPERFLLQVEGVGTFLVLRSPVVRIGPVSGASPADIALIADARTPAVEIRRTDEDYFLASEQPVRVNDRSTRQTLLADGDRLALSRHCRLRFRLPHPASTTAVLDLTAGRLPRVDVRQCLLADRQIVIGPGPAAHIHAADLAEPIVLQLEGDRLLAPTPGGVSHQPLSLDQPLNMGPLNVRLQRP